MHQRMLLNQKSWKRSTEDPYSTTAKKDEGHMDGFLWKCATDQCDCATGSRINDALSETNRIELHPSGARLQTNVKAGINASWGVRCNSLNLLLLTTPKLISPKKSFAWKWMSRSWKLHPQCVSASISVSLRSLALLIIPPHCSQSKSGWPF